MDRVVRKVVWLVVEPTHLKNISQIGSFPQVGIKIKNIWVATTKIMDCFIREVVYCTPQYHPYSLAVIAAEVSLVFC